MVSRKTVATAALYGDLDRVPPSGEFYAGLFVKLNSFLMVVFPVNSIFRSFSGDIFSFIKDDITNDITKDLFGLVPVQVLFNLGFAKLLYSVDSSTKFTLINGHESHAIGSLDVEVGVGNQVDVSDELMVKFPNFHPPYLLYFLGLFIPVSLWGGPKGMDALVPIESHIFPEKAFCVSGSMCTHEEHENVIRWWTQIVMGLLLMMWNRMSSHRINDIIVHSTQASRDLPTYQGNVINLKIQRGINFIMSAGLIAFFYNGKILDAAIARENPANTLWFNDVGVFKNALPTFYLAISYLNWKGIFPKGNWGWGLHQKNNNDRDQWVDRGCVRGLCKEQLDNYTPIAKVEDIEYRIPYLTTFMLLASTLAWVNTIDRTLFTSYDNQPSRVDMMYVNAVVFSIFLVQNFLFWFLIKPK